MKARVKATGKIVEIVGEGIQNSNMVMAAHGEWFTKDELDIVPLSWKPFEPTYWQKLEHTYAGMAMQAIVTSCGSHDYASELDELLVTPCIEIAHALVQKMKEERK
jgi:hypothetical protein